MGINVGNRIRELREKRKMSQEELAYRVGYKGRSSINKIEMGNHNIPQSKIKKIADALDTTPAYLMGWTESELQAEGFTLVETPFANEDERIVIEIMRKVDEKHRAEISNFIIKEYAKSVLGMDKSKQ